MSRHTDDQENQATYGNFTILPGTNPDEGNGSVEVYGTVFTDNILSNTINSNGVNLENIQFSNKTFTLQPAVPTVPPLGSYLYYIDSTDKLLKSVDNAGVTTVYQPSNTKGDIVVHNGTTQTRLPVGNNTQVLTADSTAVSGVKWVSSAIKNNIDIITLSYHKNVLTLDYSIGSFFLCMYPLIENGSSANYFISKSNATIIGHIVLLNKNPSLVTGKFVDATYPLYNGIQFYNNSSESDGPFKILSNLSFLKQTLTLLNTTPVNYGLTYGAYFLSIAFYDVIPSGPCTTILICKSDPAMNSAVLFQVTSSPGISPTTNIQVTWPANSPVKISKNTTAYNGIYSVIDNFQYVDNVCNVTLNNTVISDVPFYAFSYYTVKSFLVKVTSDTINGPNAIFIVSKNLNTLNGNIIRVSSLGTGTLENLNLTWLSNSLLALSKTGNGYNGVYVLTFVKL